MKTKLQSILIGLVALGAVESRAATKTWNAGSGNWNTAANWTPSGVPANGDNLVFSINALAFPETTNNIVGLNLNSITFNGTNDYSLNGNSVRLTNGIIGNQSGPIFIKLAIQLDSSQTFNCAVLGASLNLDGKISLGANTLTNSGNGTIDYRAEVGGTGGLVENGNFTFHMYLSASNSFSGPVTVNAGSLLVQDSFALGATNAGTVVRSNALLTLGNNVQIGLEPLTLDASPFSGYTVGTTTSTAVTNSWAGPITLAQDTGFYLDNTVILTSPISGPGGLIKKGPGTLVLAGSSGNLYSGTTSVEDGILQLNKSTGLSIPGPLVVEDGAVVRHLSSSDIGTVPVTVNGSGLLDLNGFSDAIGTLTLNGGSVETGAGTLTLGGTLTASDGFFGGNLSLGSATRTINVTNGLTIDAVISGTGTAGFIKTGGGELYLFGANTYPGLTTVSTGRISAFNAAAFGSTAASTVLNGGSVRVENVTVANEWLTNNSVSSALVCFDNSVSGWSSNVVLNADLAVSVFTNGTLNLSGAISGTGGIIKSQPGTLRYTGSSGNSYTGDTIVNEGVLELDKKSGASAMISGQLIIGDGSGGVNADVVRYTDNSQIATAVDIIVNDTGLLDLNNFNGTVGDIVLIGGEIDTGTGLLTISANLTATSTALTDADIVGNLNLGASARTFTVTNGPLPADLQISAAVRGSGGIIKSGDGLMALLSSNSFSGAVTLNDGTLQLHDEFSTGTTAGGVTVNSNAALEVMNGMYVGVEPLFLNSTNSSGALFAIAGSNSWAGTVTLSTDAIIRVDSSYTLNFLGQITGPGSLTKSGSGTLHYSGGSANNYAGVTTVNQGTLVLAKSVANGAMTNNLVIGDGVGGANADKVIVQGTIQIPNTVAVTVNSSGRFQLDEGQEDFGSLAGSGNVVLNHSGGIEVGFDNSSTTFSGAISGIGSLTKSGTGTMTLSGNNNTYTGVTTANAGKLVVNGSQPQSHASVGAPGTLGGSGTVGNITNTSGGVIAPGASSGILTCSNLVFAGASSDFTVELNGPSPGTGYDQLNVRGTVNLGGSTLMVSVGSGFVPNVGQTFVILTNDSTEAITGTFAGLAQGATVTAGVFQFTISYVGGSGNDVTLTLSGYTATSVTRTWSGAGTNSLWLNPSNWVGNVAPLQGDDLIFPSGAARAANTNDFTLGSGFNSITIKSNSYSLNGNALLINNGVHCTLPGPSASISFNLPLTLTQPQTFTNSNLGTLVFNGAVDNGGHDLTVFVNGGTNVFQGATGISGAGGLVKIGDGVLTLGGNGANTSSGTTRVDRGTLHLAKSGTDIAVSGPLIIGNGTYINQEVRVIGPGTNQIADTVPVTLNLGVLEVLNVGEAIGPLIMVPGGAVYTDTNLLTLTGDVTAGQANSGYSTIDGRIRLGGSGLFRNITVQGDPTEENLVISGEISSTGVGLRKDGPAALVLYADGSYPKLEIAQGPVEVYGQQIGSDVDLAGGTLAGDSGRVSRITSSSGGGVSPGYVIPGESFPGVLSSSNVVWNPATTYFVDVQGSHEGDYDQLVVAGTVNLGGSALNVSLGQGFVPAAGLAFTILSNDLNEAVSGTFAGLPEGATVSAGGSQFAISYASGDGNDVTLSVLGSPRLRILRTTTNTVAISWPFPSTGFVLQQNTNSVSSVNWSNVTATIQDDLDRLTRNVIVNPPSGTRFYRLFKP